MLISRKIFSFSIFFVAFLLLLLSPVILVDASEKNVSLSENLKFREDFGLNSDFSDVMEIIESNSQNQNEFGIPLTANELRDMKNRIDIQNNKLPAVKDKLSKSNLNKSDFTLYIDQNNNGKIVIKLKDHKNNSSKVDLGEELKNDVLIEQAIYSEMDLDLIAESIIEDSKENIVKVDSVAVDVINETIQVGLIDFTNEKATKISSYYSGLPIEVIPVVAPTLDRTAYGGEAISKNRGGDCSAGYYARNGTSYYLITAGHCSRTWNATTQTATYHYTDIYNFNGDRLGQASRIIFGGTVDATAISVSSTKATRTISINGGLRNMSSYEARYGDVVGQAVCMTGKYNQSCSTLKSKNVGYAIQGSWLSGLRGSSYLRQGGDSGGTVYSSFKYVGVHSGYGGGYSTYSQIGEVNNLLGTTGY